MTKPELLYAWWSDKQSRYAQQIYLTPEGKRLHTTCVTKIKNHGAGWDDIKFVGMVCDKCVSTSTFNRI